MKQGCVFEIRYPVVICSLRVLITGNDLRGHPIRSTDEGVPPTDRLIELGWHAKVNCKKNKIKKIKVSCVKNSHNCCYFQKRLCGREIYVFEYDCVIVLLFSQGLRLLEEPQRMCQCVIPSLTSAFSVSKTFCPLMSRWITWWEWRWERPWKTNMNTYKHSRAHTVRWPPL